MRARVPNFVSAGGGKGQGPAGAKSQGGQWGPGAPGAPGGSKENQHQMSGGVKARINSKHNAAAQQQVGASLIHISCLACAFCNSVFFVKFQQMHNSSSAPNLAQLPGAAPPFWWHSRLYPEAAGPAGIPGTNSNITWGVANLNKITANLKLIVNHGNVDFLLFLFQAKHLNQPLVNFQSIHL